MSLSGNIQSEILLLLICSLLCLFHHKLTGKRNLPATLPWSGLRKEWFPKLRANLRDISKGRQNLAEGYARYSKRGKPFVMPSLSFHPEVMLPAEHIPWLLAQPDDVMDLHEVIQDSLSFGLVSSHDAVLENPFHDTVVKNELSRRLQAITPAVVDELSTAIDELWGNDTQEWKEVCVWGTMQSIIARTSNRVFVGLPLCRDERFLHHTRKFAEAMVNQIGSIKYVLPAVLAPFLGHLFAATCHYHDRAVAKILVPMISDRIEQIKNCEETTSGEYSVTNSSQKQRQRQKPSDLLQWLILHAFANGEPKDHSPRHFASRICILNFAALHTSTISITNTFLDLLSAPHADRYFQELRDEAETVFATHDQTWSKAAVAKLVKVDSVLRETLRYTGLGGRSLVREVVAKGGVVLPDGTHLPCGARVGVAASSIHRDEEYYTHANTYDAFRFSDMRASFSESSADQTLESGEFKNEPVKADEKGRKMALSAVTTSPSFLTFGHGRRACPGRFFAVHELKLLLAMVVTRYDVKPIDGGRPENTWISDLSVPPRDATILVRRRKVEWDRL